MTSSDLFKLMIMQRQITWKWYNIQLYLQWPTNRKSYGLSNGAIFRDLERPLPTPSFEVTPFFDAEYLINGTTYRHSVIQILIGTYICHTQQCHIECEFEWLSKIFNDTKRCAVFLRQLSFLLTKLLASGEEDIERVSMLKEDISSTACELTMLIFVHICYDTFNVNCLTVTPLVTKSC